MAEQARRRGVALGSQLSRRQQLVLGVGATVWLWLLARWAAHNAVLDWLATGLGAPELIQSSVGVRAREPWLSAAPFEVLARTLEAARPEVVVIETIGGWLVWLAELAALAVTSEPALAAGAFITVQMTILGMFFGLFIAVPAALARVYGGSVLRRLSLVYTELIRGTPLLAQLFLLYFGLPLAPWFDGFELVGTTDPLSAAVLVAIIGFTVNSSAYQAEYIRSALVAVDASQLTAARSVGLSRLQAIRWVVLPQALRYAVPGWTNEFVYLLKYSSLAAFITVPELFRRGRDIGSDTFQFVEIYVIVGVVYLVMVVTIAVAMQQFERWIKLPGVGGAADKTT